MERKSKTKNYKVKNSQNSCTLIQAMFRKALGWRQFSEGYWQKD